MNGLAKFFVCQRSQRNMNTSESKEKFAYPRSQRNMNMKTSVSKEKFAIEKVRELVFAQVESFKHCPFNAEDHCY